MLFEESTFEYNRAGAEGKIYNYGHFTMTDRYPEIFSACAAAKPGAAEILSFGCSTGAECFSLRKYFPESSILGLDISRHIISRAVAKNTDPKISFALTLDPGRKFDLIFCMSVFCRYDPRKPVGTPHQTVGASYRFEHFEEEVTNLVGRLNPQGCVVIYNSNFRFSDTAYAPYFTVVPVLGGSGNNPKFDRNNKRVYDPYFDCIFKKARLLN